MLIVKVFSYTDSFLVVVGFVLFVLFFLNKTPASISAQDGRHTIDEGCTMSKLFVPCLLLNWKGASSKAVTAWKGEGKGLSRV